MPRRIIRQIPNALTVARLCAVPLFVILLVAGQNQPAGLVFLFAALTDFLDGNLARWMKVESRFGKFVDPIADRLLVGSAAILVSIYDPRLPDWAWIVVLWRDVTVAVGFTIARQKVLPDVNIAGKLATALMMASLCWLMLLPPLHLWPIWFFWLGAVVSVIALIQYWRSYRWVLDDEAPNLTAAEAAQPDPQGDVEVVGATGVYLPSSGTDPAGVDGEDARGTPS